MGQSGESQAISFLQNSGYKILEKNLRFKNHEADIIVFDALHDELVFVEVKTRMSHDYGDPSSAVDFKKIKSLQILAREYIKRKKINQDYRFDIVSVVGTRVEHFKNVTWP